MHKAGGECLTWDSCEIPAEEEERVDSQRKDRFEYQFFRIPCIWRQIFRRWKRCWIVRRGDKQIKIKKGLPQSFKGYDSNGYSLFYAVTTV